MRCGRYIVYGLTDPRTGEVRYVGRSSTGMQRPRHHASQWKRAVHRHVYCWIRNLLDAGLLYGIVVLEDLLTAADLPEAERRWIARGREMGWKLTNLTEGGEGTGGYHHSDAARARIGEATSKIERTTEWRERMSAAQRGRPKTEEQNRKNAEGHRGKKYSAESRARHSESKRRWWADPNNRAMMIRAHQLKQAARAAME